MWWGWWGGVHRDAHLSCMMHRRLSVTCQAWSQLQRSDIVREGKLLGVRTGMEGRLLLLLLLLLMMMMITNLLPRAYASHPARSRTSLG